MSEREYLIARVAKGLPRALRPPHLNASRGQGPKWISNDWPRNYYASARQANWRYGKLRAQNGPKEMLSNPYRRKSLKDDKDRAQELKRMVDGGGPSWTGARKPQVGGKGKLGRESGSLERMNAARARRMMLLEQKKPGSPGTPVLP